MTGANERPLAGQPWLSAPESRRLLEALRAQGHEVRFVGGCVRDALLGALGPGTDLDLATQARPGSVIELLAAAGIRAIPTGLAHGTVSALIDGRRFEITTLRRDVKTFGRHAEVAFTDDFREDAARRDFTINAMSCDGEGRLFDYFGGRDDLEAGRVRFVGEAARRVAEDHLRILRYFRFFARFGRGPADSGALAACAAAAPAIARLSGERIQTEMLRLLGLPAPLEALRLMEQTGVLPEILGGPAALDRLERLLGLAPEADALLRLAALVRPPPAAPDQRAWVAERWRLSRADAERLVALGGDPLPDLETDPRARRRDLYRLGAAHYADLARLAAAGHGSQAAPALAEALAAAAAWVPPQMPVRGADVVGQGVPPGPAVGRILAAVEAWWVEEDFRPDREACLERARRLATETPKAPAP